MDYYFSDTAITFLDSAKDAALYYDNIIILLPNMTFDLDKTIDLYQPLTRLFPKRLGKEFDIAYGEHWDSVFRLKVKVLSGATDITKERDACIKSAIHMYDRFNLLQYPLLIRQASHSPVVITPSESDDTLLTLSGLRLVDLTRTSWEHICEFRKDTQSRKALRRLKLFFSRTTQGKTVGTLKMTFANGLPTMMIQWKNGILIRDCHALSRLSRPSFS